MAKKKSNAGRPSMGRDAYLEVRLTPIEKERISEAARRNGLSISDFVRLCMANAAKSETSIELNVPSSKPPRNKL